jgi:hypothetical protein
MKNEIVEDIKYIFKKAVSSLFVFAERVCSNELSRKVVFIKCYGYAGDRIQYELNSFQRRMFVCEQDVLDELLLFNKTGKKIGLIDLTLFYSFPTETVVLVDILFTEENKPVGIHLSARRTGKNLELERFNLNDYVDELARRLLK